MFSLNFWHVFKRAAISTRFVLLLTYVDQSLETVLRDFKWSPAPTRQQISYYVYIFVFVTLLSSKVFFAYFADCFIFFCRNCEEYWSCEKITVRVNTSNTGLASSSQHPVERKLGNSSGHVTISKYWKFFFLVIYQTWEKVFNNISKHLEERWKTDAKQRTFWEQGNVWKFCSQTH